MIESLARLSRRAIDYAADVVTWSLEKLGEVCASYSGEALEDVLGQAFPDLDLESPTEPGELAGSLPEHLIACRVFGS